MENFVMHIVLMRIYVFGPQCPHKQTHSFKEADPLFGTCLDQPGVIHDGGEFYLFFILKGEMGQPPMCHPLGPTLEQTGILTHSLNSPTINSDARIVGL